MLFVILERLTNFPLKGQIVNVLGCSGHVSSSAGTLLSHRGAKAAMAKMQMREGGCVPLKLFIKADV